MERVWSSNRTSPLMTRRSSDARASASTLRVAASASAVEAERGIVSVSMVGFADITDCDAAPGRAERQGELESGMGWLRLIVVRDLRDRTAWRNRFAIGWALRSGPGGP